MLLLIFAANLAIEIKYPFSKESLVLEYCLLAFRQMIVFIRLKDNISAFKAIRNMFNNKVDISMNVQGEDSQNNSFSFGSVNEERLFLIGDEEKENVDTSNQRIAYRKPGEKKKGLRVLFE